MKLYLPQTSAHPARPKAPPVRMGMYLTLEQLGGPPVITADVMAELVKLKRSDVIRWIAAISVQLADPNGFTQERQRQMARQLLPDDLNADLEKWLRDGQQWNWALFHRRQMWLLLQFAVLACKEDAASCDDPVMAKIIGRLGIMTSAILQAIEPKQEGGEWKADYNYCFVPSTIPILEHTDRMEMLARAHAFWFELPKTPAIVERFRQAKTRDVVSVFEEKYSLPLERFYLISLGLWSAFQNHANNSASPLLVESDLYLVPRFGKEDTAKALQILSQSPEALASDLLGKPRQNWAIDSSLLKAKPVIEVFPGKYACPDIGSLHRYLTDGIYFLLQAAYPEELFRQLFGYIFEEYINNLIGSFGVESDLLTRTFWRSPKFVGTNDQVCDGLLHDRELALVMEYKARLLTTREKYAGIPEVTWKGINDILAKNTSGGKKGAFQLASSIRRMLAQEPAFSGKSLFHPTEKTTIIPVLITYEDAMNIGAIRKGVDERMREALTKENVDPSRIGPLLILTIYDIEVLEALTNNNQWIEIIRGYAKYVQEHVDDPIATLGVYLSKCSFKSEDPGTSSLAKAFAKAVKFAEERLAKKL